MVRAKVHGVFEQDLKEAISWAKKSQYENMLARAHGEREMRELDRKIRIDPQLTQEDQAKLLAEVNGNVSQLARESQPSQPGWPLAL